MEMSWRNSVEEEKEWLSEMRAVEWPEDYAEQMQEVSRMDIERFEEDGCERKVEEENSSPPQEVTMAEHVVATAQVCAYELNEHEAWAEVANGDWVMLYLIEQETAESSGFKSLRVAAVDPTNGEVALASEVGADAELAFANSQGELTSEATSFGELCCGHSYKDGVELPYYGLRFGDAQQATAFSEALRVAAKKVAVALMTKAACQASERYKIDAGAETRNALRAMGFDDESIETAIARIGSDESADLVANAILEDALGGKSEEEFLLRRNSTLSPSISPKSMNSSINDIVGGDDDADQKSLIEPGLQETDQRIQSVGHQVFQMGKSGDLSLPTKKAPEPPTTTPPKKRPGDFFFEQAARHVEFSPDQFQLTAWALVEGAARNSLTTSADDPNLPANDPAHTERAATAATRCARQLLFDGDTSRDVFWACLSQRSALAARGLLVTDRPKAIRDSIEADVKDRVVVSRTSSKSSANSSVGIAQQPPPVIVQQLPMIEHDEQKIETDRIVSPTSLNSSVPPPPPTPTSKPPEKNPTRFRSLAGVVTSLTKKIGPSPFRRNRNRRNSEDSLTPTSEAARRSSTGNFADALRESTADDDDNAQAHRRAMDEQVVRAVQRASSDLCEDHKASAPLYKMPSSENVLPSRRSNEMSRQPFSPNDFEPLKVLGKGSFGAVALSRRLADGQIFAIKVLEKRRLVGQRAESMARLERDVLDQLSHARHMPFVARMRFAFHSISKLYIAMDYFPHGSLHFVLKQDTPTRRYGRKAALMVCAELASALEHVHAACVVHRYVCIICLHKYNFFF
uniref:Protein kinase domain-containing protein n=1 Tax=Aureoumbra lagunensis TaxID=44058 RepID=A0A7S3K052_9STRA